MGRGGFLFELLTVSSPSLFLCFSLFLWQQKTMWQRISTVLGRLPFQAVMLHFIFHHIGLESGACVCVCVINGVSRMKWSVFKSLSHATYFSMCVMSPVCVCVCQICTPSVRSWVMCPELEFLVCVVSPQSSPCVCVCPSPRSVCCVSPWPRCVHVCEGSLFPQPVMSNRASRWMSPVSWCGIQRGPPGTER